VKSPVFASDLGHRKSSTFFNGEVIELDGPLDAIPSNAADEAAA